MLPKSTGWPVFVYGILLIILGIMGYQKTGSAISLYVGVGMGVAVLISSIAMLKQFKWSSYSALLFTLLLTITFAFRYTATGKVFPGLMSVISGGMLLYLFGSFAKQQQNK
jgi:uncharacterized membrane protein (UPF0136 family)